MTGDSVDVDALTMDLDGTNFTADYTSISSAATGTNAVSGDAVTVTATGANATIGADVDIILNANNSTRSKCGLLNTPCLLGENELIYIQRQPFSFL